MGVSVSISTGLPWQKASFKEGFFCYGKLEMVLEPMLLEKEIAMMLQRNKRLHWIFDIEGQSLSGIAEIERLQRDGVPVGKYAQSCFSNTTPEGYDANHRLIGGGSYTFAVIPGHQIEKQQHIDWTNPSLLQLGASYGYGKPRAGHVPRFSEVITIGILKEMGVSFVAFLHDPIKGSDGHFRVLRVRQGVDCMWIDSRSLDMHKVWNRHGAFAFPVSDFPSSNS